MLKFSLQSYKILIGVDIMTKYLNKTEPVFTHGDTQTIKPKKDDELNTILALQQFVL